MTGKVMLEAQTEALSHRSSWIWKLNLRHDYYLSAPNKAEGDMSRISTTQMASTLICRLDDFLSDCMTRSIGMVVLECMDLVPRSLIGGI